MQSDLPDVSPRMGPVVSGTEMAVCLDIAMRQQMGIKKYGTTVRDNPLALRAWVQHAYEEALDLAVYLKRVTEELDAQKDDLK
jgi:hypothetical protein